MTKDKKSGQSTRAGRSQVLSKFAIVLGVLVLALLLTLVNSACADAASRGGNGKIAFRSNRDGNEEIYVMNADGANHTRLTNNPAADDTPSWSPDGAKIAFFSDRDGKWEIYVMNVDGTNQTRLTNTPALDHFPSWSPDGTKILFSSLSDTAVYGKVPYTEQNWEIYVMNADGTNQTRLTNSPGYDDWASYSPDGTKIAFRSYRDGNEEVYVMNADGTNQTRLTHNPALDGHPAWSRDGTKIAFRSDRDGNEEIYVMNADGTNQTRLTNDPEGDDSPSWSPDGAKIVFSSGRDGNEQILCDERGRHQPDPTHPQLCRGGCPHLVALTARNPPSGRTVTSKPTPAPSKA